MHVDPLETTSKLAELLNTYGPWAVMSITIIVAVIIVWYLGKRISNQVDDLNAQIQQKNEVIALKEDQIDKKDAQLLDLVEKRHTEFTKLMEETVNALSTASDTNQRLIVLMNNCERDRSVWRRSPNS